MTCFRLLTGIFINFCTVFRSTSHQTNKQRMIEWCGFHSLEILISIVSRFRACARTVTHKNNKPVFSPTNLFHIVDNVMNLDGEIRVFLIV